MQHNTQSAPLNNMSIEASLNSSTGWVFAGGFGQWAGFGEAYH